VGVGPTLSTIFWNAKGAKFIILNS
jgi:hypothetical protein